MVQSFQRGIVIVADIRQVYLHFLKEGEQVQGKKNIYAYKKKSQFAPAARFGCTVGSSLLAERQQHLDATFLLLFAFN